MHNIKPLISKRDGSERKGKGFSRDELEKAGVTTIQARKMGFSVDTKRKSCNDENVECVKAHAEKMLPALKAIAKKPKKKAKSQ
jgi:ribosomal protein L13E